MSDLEMLRLTHEARIQIAREYLEGKRDDQPLNGVMVRLVLRSLETEREMKAFTASACD